MKLATRLVPVTVTELKHRVDVNSLDQLAAKYNLTEDLIK